jgi:predicted PurR-regulated permease PerM
VYFILVLIALSLSLWALYTLIVPLLLGFLLAFLLHPAVDFLERRKWKRSMATFFLFVVIGILLYTSIYFLAPLLRTQGAYFVDNRETYIQLFTEKLEFLEGIAKRYLPTEIITEWESWSQNLLVNGLNDLQKTIPTFITTVLNAATNIFFGIVIAFFFVVEGREIKKFFVSLMPNRYFEMILMILHQVNTQLGGYLRGQIIDCSIMATIYITGLSLLDVKGAVAIGIFAGIANAIPYLAPIIGSIPAMLVLLLDPAATMPWWSVAILFSIAHVLDATYIYPMTVGKSVNLHPFVVILGILFGGSVGGIIGMLVVIPLIGMANKAFLVLHSTLKSYRVI